MEWGIHELLGTALLGIGLIDDLRTRKIHNRFVITALILTLITAYFAPLSNTQVWIDPLLSLGLAFALVLPLFGFKVWGGGDAKLFLAVSPLLIWPEIPIFLIMSLAWGAVLGLIRIIISGRIPQMLANIGQIIFHRQAVAEKNLVPIPFSIALLFGYLATLTLRHYGVHP